MMTLLSEISKYCKNIELGGTTIASYLVCQIRFFPVVRKFCQFQWNKQTLHLPYKGKQHD